METGKGISDGSHSRRSTLRVRLDPDLKKEAEALFSDLGMSLPTAIEVFLRQALRQRDLPFRIRQADDPFFRKENLESLRHSIAQFERGEAKVRPLVDIDS